MENQKTTLSKRYSYRDRRITPTRALIGMEGASKTSKIMWQVKLFNHKKSAIRSFLGTWYIQFAVFQNEFAIFDLRSLIANPVLKKKKKKIKKVAQNILEDIYVLKSPKTTI